MDGEVLYDENAMNNAYNLLVTANSNLELAKDYYDNDKLTGSALVSSAESVMNNVEQAIAKAAEALASIDVGMGELNTDFSGANEGSIGDEAPSIIDFGMGPLNSDLFGVYEVNSSEGANAEGTTEGPTEWTPESVAEYKESVLANIEICDEMIEQASQDISDMKNELDGFLCLPFLYVGEYHLIEDGGRILTPEEYLQYLINNITARDCLDENGNFSQEIYEAKIKECKDMAEEYKVNFAAAFMAAMGESYESYEEFETKLNDANEVLTAARSAKYPLEQQKKLLPFLDIMATDEYKEFASQDHEDDVYLAALREEYRWKGNLYDCNIEGRVVNSYITEEEEMFLLYLYENRYEGLPSYKDYVKAIEDNVNKARGEKECQELLAKCTNEKGEIDWTAYNALVFGAEGFGDGVATFFDGLENCLRTDGMISDTQYKQMFLYQILGQDTVFSEDAIALQFCYENGSIIGNMAVPMLFSFALGPSGAGLLGASTAAGASSVLMGLSAGGNAKNQALVDGYSMPNAYLYGIFSALSESATNYFLGKIPFISQSSGLTLGNLFSEGFQEFTQEFYDAGLRAVLFGEAIDLRELTGDALKAFVMGAIVAGELNGLQAITVMTQAGETVEIPFSEIEKLCQENPDMSVLEAATVLMGKAGANIPSMNQDILDLIFCPSYKLTAETKQWLVSFLQTNRDLFASELVQNGYKKNFKEAYEWVDGKIATFSAHDTKTLSAELMDTLSRYLFPWANLSPSEITDFVNKLTPLEGDVEAQENIVKYMENKFGLSSKDVYAILQEGYNRSTGGLCPYGTLAEILLFGMTEEKVMAHYGVEKFVTLKDGTTVLNPAILADMVFQMNHEGGAGARIKDPWGIVTYDFVQENGDWKLKSGELRGSSFAGPNGMDIDRVNRYLESVGLRLKLVSKHTGGKQGQIGDEVAKQQYIEDMRKQYRADIEQALKDGHQVALGMNSYGGDITLENIGTGETDILSGRSSS